MPSTPEIYEPQSAITSLMERPTIVAEANFLRLPLFALHTKGLKHLDGFNCKGTTTRDENTWEFTFRTARSTATLYPGPLSRSVHLAFLSLITEHGLPFANPIKWKWRSLCARLGVHPSGRMVRHLKEAIEATAGLTIYSQDALYSKPTGQRFNTSQAMHLYETVVFVNQTLPDGRRADANYLWLSGWYLDNLNAMFTAPLDHELWRFLEKRSPIASRLYEFLLINFHSEAPQLRINYPRLAQFLPVHQEKYLSDARRQLEPAFQLLTEARVAASIAWHTRPEDVAQLRFSRGEVLLRSGAGKWAPQQSDVQSVSTLVSVQPVRRAPEHELVDEFYRLWTGRSGHTPNSADLVLARRLLAQYGRIKTRKLLPLVIDQLKRHWPSAKTFVAVDQYIDAAAEQFERQQQRDQQRLEHQKTAREQLEATERSARERQQFETNWLPVWEQLAAGERDAIRGHLLNQHLFLRHAPHQLQFRCLQELARRAAERSDTAAGAGETPLRTERNTQL